MANDKPSNETLAAIERSGFETGRDPQGHALDCPYSIADHQLVAAWMVGFAQGQIARTDAISADLRTKADGAEEPE